MKQQNLIKQAAFTALLGVTVCMTSYAKAGDTITIQDVLDTEQAWADSIVKIGKVHQQKGNYQAEASAMIDRLYSYDQGKVLFKPTKAAKDQFRETKEEALSYFIGGSNPEDHGFAIQPWSNVRFENHEIIINPGGKTAEAMGNYYFTDAKSGKEIKVEFTMGFEKLDNNQTKIFLHHSSLPYNPEKN